MAFSPLEQALDYVEQLPDQPSLSEGYSPAELKRVFDRAAQEIKTYLNETLIAQLESALAGASGAESIGSAAANGIPAGTLHGQILALKALYDTFDRDFRDAVSGILPPGTIAFDRLDAATRQKIDAGANRDRAVFYRNVPGTYTFTAPRTGTYRIRLCGGGAGGTYANPLILDDSRLTNYAEYFGFGGASASALETYLDLTLGESFPLTVGAGAAPASGGFPWTRKRRSRAPRSRTISSDRSIAAPAGRAVSEARRIACALRAPAGKPTAKQPSRLSETTPPIPYSPAPDGRRTRGRISLPRAIKPRFSPTLRARTARSAAAARRTDRRSPSPVRAAAEPAEALPSIRASFARPTRRARAQTGLS